MDFIKYYFNKIMPLGDESLQLLSQCIEKVEISSGTILLKEGKRHPYMYIICKGIIRGFKSKDGVEVTTTFWMEDETFGDVKSYITNDPVSKTYQAMENMIVYRVDKFKFRQLLTLNLELATLGRLIIEKFAIRNDIRMIILSNKKAKDRYIVFCNLRKGVHTKVPLKYIASYLQITPETLSRIRSSF